jgi:hypothetical protein
MEQINLVENKQAREELIGHLEALDKVKSIAFLTKDMILDTKSVADYYDVSKSVIDSVVNRNKEELISNGLKVIKGEELKEFKAHLQDASDLNRLKFVSSLTLFTKRTILNVAMLLTESIVAEKVRDYLLNIEDKTTVGQKEEAIEEVADKTIESLNLKLLRKQFREEKKLVEIQSAVEKCIAFGMTQKEASYLIQSAIVNKENIQVAILNKVKTDQDKTVEINRGIVREKIAYVAKHYFDDDYEMVYHIMSEKMRYKIGFNMRAHRDRLKKKHGNSSSKVPSYLDLIVEFNAYDLADNAIKEIMDEKEELKALKVEKQKETVAIKKAVKVKEIEVENKEEDFTF